MKRRAVLRRALRGAAVAGAAALGALGLIGSLGCGDNAPPRGQLGDAGGDGSGSGSCVRQGDKVRAVSVAKVSGSATLVTSPPGDARLFVLEQEGRIRIIEGGKLLAEPFLDLRDDAGGPVRAGGEQGLLGLAFHPRFADNGLFYVYYSTRASNAVASYRVAADNANRGDAASAQVLLDMPDRFANHNGGMIEFGPDGLLYVGTGDGGSANDPDGNGQNRFALLGKMLRLDVDRPSGGKRYGIPADNPFADGASGAPEVYMTGLRNPWRWSFDGATMYIGDVGQDRYEEIDIVPAPLARGANLGWKTYEAERCTSGTCSPDGLIFPQIIRNHGAGAGNGWCSITGGAVYRGECSPGMVGRYYYTDYCRGGLSSLAWDGAAAIEQREEDGDFPGKVSSIYAASGAQFGASEAAAGELYMTTTDGDVYRLVARP